jgi:predicted RNA methylase
VNYKIPAAILQHIAEDVNINDKNGGGLLVADLGCGTGVLLIGAALIGARFEKQILVLIYQRFFKQKLPFF